jgi:hypothetical protein
VRAPRFKELQVQQFKDAAGQVVIDRCQGVQIGDRNVQINSYEFDVSRVKVRLDRVLARHDVRTAFSRLAADPENAKLRAKADSVLGAGPLFVQHPRVETRVRPVITKTRSTDFWHAVVVRECQGVQVSDHAYQESRFVYVTTAALNGRQLLRESPELRNSLIETCCGDGTSPVRDDIAQPLRNAVEDAVLRSGTVGDRGAQVTPSTRWTVAIQDGQGVSVGRSHREHSVSVDVRTKAVRRVSSATARRASRTVVPPSDE